MSDIVRECCNYCMWFGPVNADGTMRKHRPATLEDKYGHPNKVQDMSAAPCPGSNKPFATFGCETVPDPRTTEKETETVTEPRYTVAPYNRRSSFAVYDSVTDLDVAHFSSRYAAQDKADRLNESEQSQAARDVASILTPMNAPADCPRHGVDDMTWNGRIEVPACAGATTYGAWSEGAGGFIYSGDCALEVANWAAGELRGLAKEGDTDTIQILAVCREHEEQPAYGCEDCS